MAIKMKLIDISDEEFEKQEARRARQMEKLGATKRICVADITNDLKMLQFEMHPEIEDFEIEFDDDGYIKYVYKLNSRKELHDLFFVFNKGVLKKIIYMNNGRKIKSLKLCEENSTIKDINNFLGGL